MPHRFTGGARAAVVEAQAQARGLGHHEIRAEHLLLGVMAGADDLVPLLAAHGLSRQAVLHHLEQGPDDAAALREVGVDLDEVRRRAEESFGPGALERPVPVRRRFLTRSPSSAHLPFAVQARRGLEQSLREAISLGDNRIGEVHVLLGLLAEEAAPLEDLLERAGVEVPEVRADVVTSRRRAA